METPDGDNLVRICCTRNRNAITVPKMKKKKNGDDSNDDENEDNLRANTGTWLGCALIVEKAVMTPLHVNFLP